MKEETIKTLEKYSQQHLFKYLPYLTEEEEKALEEQILKIDFEELKQIYEFAKNEPQIEEKRIEKISYTDELDIEVERKNKLEEIGRNAICKGQYAVITMAGGQGTRLGYDGPKGAYSLDTIKGKKYLFEIHIDNLKKAQKQYGVTIPWYIMTSRENHKQTLEFLEEHNYFGYDKTKVKLFMQGELPLVNTEGEVILDKDKKIKEAANGNGGIYESLQKSGILEEMKERGIEWIFVNNVDNVLAYFVDPLLLGLTIEQNQKIGVQSILKKDANEKVGVLCKMNGRPKVIEYIDLPKEMAEERNENGELIYSDVSMGAYLFNRSVFEDLATSKLPYHAAFKKSGYLNEEGKYVESKDPNVYKFETFIFDSFVRYENISILRRKREEVFAPVKNKEGNDSPETATKLYNDYMKGEN